MRDWGRAVARLRLELRASSHLSCCGRIFEISWKGMLVLLVWAALDYLLVRQKLESDLRMSRAGNSRRDERDGRKSADQGAHPPPATPGAPQQMLQDVQRATVVITNPTHFAVALQYGPELAAPDGGGQRRNLLAQKIKEMARWHDIPIVENPPLAQALYRTRRSGQTDSGQAVRRGGEILAFVYRAQARRAARRRRERSRWQVSIQAKPRASGADRLPTGLLPVAAVRMVFVMLVPVPAFLLDMLLAISITASVLVLLAALHILRPVQFSVFPSLLLLLTLFRLSLNLASSRRILLHGNEGAAAAGSVIEAFGQFVVGGNYVVGSCCSWP